MSWRSGRSACVLVLALAVASAAGPLHAGEAELPASLSDLARLTAVQVRLLAEAKAMMTLAPYGFAKGNCVLGASLAKKESLSASVTLLAGHEYAWAATGDDENTTDVDLKVEDSDGNVVAEDDREDAGAAVTFKAVRSGQYRVTLTLFDAPDVSFVALVALEKNGGWTIPLENLSVAMGGFLASAMRSAQAVDTRSSGLLCLRLRNASCGWCLFGCVMEQNDEHTVGNLNLGRGRHVFIGRGCGQAQDIDLVVKAANGGIIAQDLASDATPICDGATDGRNAPYAVTTSLPASRGAALTLTGILKVELAKDAGSRILPGAWAR